MATTIFLVNPQTFPSSWANDYSLTFDGVDESVNLGRVTATESASNISLSFWFKVPSLASNEQLLGRFNSSNAKQLKCNTKTGGEFAFWTRNSADTAGVECRTPASTIAANTWYHALVTYDGTQGTNAGKVKIYIDGVSQTLTFSGTVKSTTDNGTNNFLIGGIAGGAGYCLMDEVRIYDYTLTGTDATNIYNSGSPTEENQSPVAIHKYRFEDADSSWDGSNYTFTDLGSAASNDGTSQNMEEADRQTDTP